MAEGQLREAYALIKQGNKQEATRIIQAVLKADHNNANAWWLLANALEDLVKQEKAIKRVLSIDPDHTAAKKKLASLHTTSAVSTSQQAASPAKTNADQSEPTSASQLEFDFTKLEEMEAKIKTSTPDSEAQAVRIGNYLMIGSAVVIAILVIGFVAFPTVSNYLNGIQIQTTAADFFEAVTDSRFSDANALLCTQYRYSDDELADLERRFAVIQGMSFDLEGVGLEVVSQSGDTATVRFTGEIGTSILGQSTTMSTDEFAEMSFSIEEAVLGLVREDGRWLVCDEAINLTE